MFESEVERGRELLQQLVRLGDLTAIPTELQAVEQLSFARSEATWRADTEAKILETLGDDPRSRFSYMLHLVEKGLEEPSKGASPEIVALFRGAVDFLVDLDERLDPDSFHRAFDWSRPIDATSPTPTPAEIEAKRWEYCEALIAESKKVKAGTQDPLDTARAIGLHEIHAREFFVSLASRGRLRRDTFTPEWQQVARQADSSEEEGPPASAPEATKSLRAFLCHASEDKEAVRELARFLREQGHRPWLDEDRILPGQDWDFEIRKALREADVVLVCLSERSSKRGYVQKELKRALDIADEFPEGAIFVIPVRLTDCDVPERLAKLHWVDLYEPNGPGRLAAALQRRADH